MASRRIAIVTDSFLPAVDSTTRTLGHVVDRLIDAGHEVSVIAPGPGLPSYRGAPITRVSTLERPGRQVRAALEKIGPDVVQVSSPGTVGRKALKQASRVGVPSLVVQQAPVPPLLEDLWRQKVAERADRVLVTADWMRGRLGELGVDAPLWRPGVDAAAFTPALRDDWLHGAWSKRKSRPRPLVVVGYVGSLRNQHDVRRLVEAQLPDTRLVVIGDGPQRAWLAERLPRAQFVGNLSTGHLATAVASLDVLLHPGTQQTCAHALREAAASGVPVLAPDCGGAAEVVRPRETGLLYDPRTRSGLREALASLVADQRRGLLGEQGRELALARGWNDAVAELEGHLAELAGPRPGPVEGHPATAA